MVPPKKVQLKDGIGQNCGLTSRCSFQTAVTSLDKSCRAVMCKNVTKQCNVLN